MPAQPGFDGHLWMVELGVELHPEAFHHGAGVQVDDGGECHKLMEVELCEAERDGLLCGLRGIAQAPIWFRQAPADLHAGGEREVVRWNMQADKADESLRRPFLNRPESPPTLVDQSHHPLAKRIALFSGPRRRVVTHDIGIRIHRREWFKVRWPPLSE